MDTQEDVEAIQDQLDKIDETIVRDPKNRDNMRKLILILILTFPLFSFSQNWADDSSLDEIINNKSAFGDDESSIVIIEFWASFNAANAFSEWDKIKGVDYYRVDIGKAP